MPMSDLETSVEATEQRVNQREASRMFADLAYRIDEALSQVNREHPGLTTRRDKEVLAIVYAMLCNVRGMSKEMSNDLNLQSMKVL